MGGDSAILSKGASLPKVYFGAFPRPAAGRSWVSLCGDFASARSDGCHDSGEHPSSSPYSVAMEIHHRRRGRRCLGARASRALEARALPQREDYKNADVARCLLAMVIGCRCTQPMAVLGQIRVLRHGFYWPRKVLSHLAPPAPLPDVSAKTGYLEPPARSLAGSRGGGGPTKQLPHSPPPTKRRPHSSCLHPYDAVDATGYRDKT